MLGTSTVLDLLAFDTKNPSSIAGALYAARENARGAREIISSELWEALNTTWNAVPAAAQGGLAPRARTRSWASCASGRPPSTASPSPR